MARAKKTCSRSNCPVLVPAGTRFCPEDQAEHERSRGTRQQRGYDARHDKLRARWKPKVERGGVKCARCDQPIYLGQEWALDHTDDRTGYLGPSHAICNNRAGGKAAHGGEHGPHR